MKYTDVDYRVFTDGARHVSEGGSPYDRHTYRYYCNAETGGIDLHQMQQKRDDILLTRYSPLLAYMMLPNMWSPCIGKLVFVMFDILAGHLIYCILRCSIIHIMCLKITVSSILTNYFIDPMISDQRPPSQNLCLDWQLAHGCTIPWS